MDALKKLIRHVPDFPKSGILFYDITTLLRDRSGFAQAVECLAVPYRDSAVDLVIGIESRGFILGAAVADRLNVGFVPVRKAGKLPARTLRAEYDLEYGTDTLEIHTDALSPGQRVLMVDDLLATGGTVEACCQLLEKTGAHVVGCAFLIELAGLGGLERIAPHEAFSLIRYE